MITGKKKSWYERVPKVELHLHLTGAIPHETLWEMIKKYGGGPSVPDINALEEKFRYRDFMHFLETWVWKNRFLREYEDFTFLSEAVARDLVSQNILYAEVFFSMSRFINNNLTVTGLAEAVRAGLSRVPEIDINLIIDLVRDNGPENAERILPDIIEAREFGVIGIGLGGAEQLYPPELFTDVFEKARRAGLQTTAHAGEAAGPESIWSAINNLKIERIGHATRAIEDEKLVDYLAEHSIPLEICPISNVKTGVVESIKKHPVRYYYDRNIPVTINTDDPKMFGNSLAEEYEILANDLGFIRDEIRTMLFNAVRTSWLPDNKKRGLAGRLINHPDW
ncbi:MAG: adenosine deaminase [Chloroflexi bacterium RBG_13_46_14]|nr:MAG: adenosine deaminase [Chloroflexi bacterium RBG_13_46_14]